MEIYGIWIYYGDKRLLIEILSRRNKYVRVIIDFIVDDNDEYDDR